MKNTIFAVLFSAFSLPLISQDDVPVYYGSSVVPPSPTSASLGKYGDVPVTLYTGVPEISIPIYTIREGNLSLPVSLSYHSQGFKVEEMASWVGLGWSLNAGGTITRAVKGVPDDFLIGFGDDGDFGGGAQVTGGSTISGYLSSGNLVEDMYNSGMTNSNSTYYTPYLAYNGLDGEPDIFYFNFPGGTGQFIFDKNGSINFLSQQNYKVNYFRGPSNGPIIKFEIIDGNGNIYTFDEVEQTKTISYTNTEPLFTAMPAENQTPYSAFSWQDYQFKPMFNSSWHLTKITNATKNHIITLNYTLENQQFVSNFSRQYRYWNLATQGNMTDNSWNTLAIAAKRLSSITTSNGSVSFNATINRDDMNGMDAWNFATAPPYDYIVPAGDAKALSSIEIKDAANTLIKKYNFGFSYFLANNIATAGGFVSLYKKLKLTSLTEQSGDLSSSNPPYTFEYDETVPMAPRFSMRQDHWGFLKSVVASGNLYVPLTYDYPNNPIDNDFLSEFSYFQRTTNNSGEVVWGTYDKSAEATASKSCIIKKITYPTKGTTTFEFEPHDFYLQGLTRIGGGLRIKTITDFDGLDHDKDIIKNYSYKQTAAPTVTSGKVLTLPVFAKRGWCSSNQSHPLTLFVNSIAPLGSTMGSFVGYGEVTVEHNGNGKVISKFHLPATAGVDKEDCDMNGNNCIYNRTKSILSFGPWGAGGSTTCLKDNFPYADNPNYDWNRGSLLEELIYDNQNRLVKKNVNEYIIKDYKKIPCITSSLLTKNVRGTPAWNAWDYWFYFKTALHYYISGWKVMNKQTTTIYDVNNPGSQLVTSTSYFYDNPTHKQLSRTASVNSSGQTMYTQHNRSLDIPGTYSSNEYHILLKNQNRLNEIIESFSWIAEPQAPNNPRVLSASLTEYKDFSSTTGVPSLQVLPYKKYALEISTPLALASFNPLNLNWSSIAVIDSRYKPIIEFNYDNKDNLTGNSAIIGTLKASSANIFGYGKNMLIAQVNNATEADCGFTSFESDDQNLWAFGGTVALNTADAHTGASCRTIPANTFGPTRNYMPGANAQNKKFILSCWVKTNSSASGAVGSLVLTSVQNIGSTSTYPNVTGAYVSATINNTNNVWKYIEVEIDLKQIKMGGGIPNIDLALRSFVWNTHASIGIQVDDIRFYPKEARMSSYSYRQSIGASSISDENSNCRYYEYDSFGRLKIVKDQRGNILEKTDYNYKP
jgi:hypothetical protein